MPPLPRIVLTGASGFVGRRVIETLRPRYRVVAIDRHPQAESDLSDHPNVAWHQIDIAEREPMARLFADLAATGGAAVVLHLAAHYDFTGEDHVEYQRTNVEGTRLVLELARGLGPERFVFASSVAACRFPPPGEALDERSPTDAEHLYGRSKHIGEELVNAAQRDFPTAIVRFAALFSDWCEYAPLFMFIETWLSRRWNARVLGGRGRSAVPYLHVRDLALFLDRVVERRAALGPAEVLIASPDGAVSHDELFRATTGYFHGRPRRPLHVPRLLARPGIWCRFRLGQLLGDPPFERPWMGRYIDYRLAVDAHHTRERLDWAPRRRLEILRRIPFLIENRRSDPGEWYRRNEDPLHLGTLHPTIRLHSLLEAHREEISVAFTGVLLGPEGQAHLPHYREVTADEHAWHHKVILHSLIQSVRTRERGIFIAYCRDLAERRARQGYSVEEVCYALRALDRVCLEILAPEAGASGIGRALYDSVTVTIGFGIDAVEEVFEYLEGPRHESPALPPAEALRQRRRESPPAGPALPPGPGF